MPPWVWLTKKKKKKDWNCPRCSTAPSFPSSAPSRHTQRQTRMHFVYFVYLILHLNLHKHNPHSFCCWRKVGSFTTKDNSSLYWILVFFIWIWKNCPTNHCIIDYPFLGNHSHRDIAFRWLKKKKSPASVLQAKTHRGHYRCHET